MSACAPSGAGRDPRAQHRDERVGAGFVQHAVERTQHGGRLTVEMRRGADALSGASVTAAASTPLPQTSPSGEEPVPAGSVHVVEVAADVEVFRGGAVARGQPHAVDVGQRPRAQALLSTEAIWLRSSYIRAEASAIAARAARCSANATSSAPKPPRRASSSAPRVAPRAVRPTASSWSRPRASSSPRSSGCGRMPARAGSRVSAVTSVLPVRSSRSSGVPAIVANATLAVNPTASPPCSRRTPVRASGRARTAQSASSGLSSVSNRIAARRGFNEPARPLSTSSASCMRVRTAHLRIARRRQTTPR